MKGRGQQQGNEIQEGNVGAGSGRKLSILELSEVKKSIYLPLLLEPTPRHTLYGHNRSIQGSRRAWGLLKEVKRLKESYGTTS